jgi:hypothetical protein
MAPVNFYYGKFSPSGSHVDQRSAIGEVMNEFSLLIGGKLMRGAATLEVINPATEEILATAPRADHVQLGWREKDSNPRSPGHGELRCRPCRTVGCEG